MIKGNNIYSNLFYLFKFINYTQTQTQTHTHTCIYIYKKTLKMLLNCLLMSMHNK